MCYKYVIFCLLLLLYDKVQSKPTVIKCPEYCSCDIYYDLKRATCQFRKLISVEIDMPPQAEILDLSHNQISQLGQNIFLEIGLTNLKLLNMSSNKLSQIHFQGFEGLSNLKSLDLSYNMLKYFLDHWWVSLNSLEELYLAGNMLRTINTEPRIKLQKLKVLDLSFSGIESLKSDVFSNLPNLEVLDLSKNLLLDFKVDVIKPLPMLKSLNLKENSFECNDHLPKWALLLKNYTANNNIRHYETCLVGVHSQKFQRMMVEEEPLHKRGWLFDEEIQAEDKQTNVVMCEDKKELNETGNIYFHHIMRVIELSPPLAILFLFVFGFAVGILFGCTCQVREKPEVRNSDIDQAFLDDDVLVVSKPTNKLRANNHTNNKQSLKRSLSSNSGYRPRTRSTGSRRMLREDRNLLLINEYKLSDSTPVLVRKTAQNDIF